MKNNQTIGYILTFGLALILILTCFWPSEDKQQDINAICVGVVLGIIGTIFLGSKRISRLVN